MDEVSSAAAAPQLSRASVFCAGMAALVLTVGLARFAYTPLLPIMREQAGLGTVAGGWLATFNYLGYMIGALIAARTHDLHRKYAMYRIGLAVAVLSTAAMGLTLNVYAWALLRFVSGVSSTAGLLLASGLVLNWLTRSGHRPELGFHFAGLGLGIVVSGLAVELMATRVAWDEQWIGLGLLGAVLFVPAWFWMPAPVPRGAHGAVAPRPPPPRRWLASMLGAYFCAGFGYVISATFIVAIVGRLPALAGKGNWVWVTVGVAAIPASFLWDRAARALGDTPALILAYALQIVSILLPVFSGGAAANLLSAVLYGGTFVGIVSLMLTIIGRRYPVNPAKAMAGLTLSYGLAQILAPAMAGYIAAASGSYRDALMVAAGVMAVGMLWLAASGPPQHAPGD